jgi:hypothetical protein
MEETSMREQSMTSVANIATRLFAPKAPWSNMTRPCILDINARTAMMNIYLKISVCSMKLQSIQARSA